MMVTVVMAAFLALAPLQDAKAQDADKQSNFEKDLDAAKRQDHGLSLEAVIAGYQAVIARYDGDPRVVEAILAIAHLHEGAKNPETALEWFRKAAATATRGTKFWAHANFMLVNRVIWKDIDEARRIVDAIAANANGDSLTLAQIESARFSICLTTKPRDYSGAEAHCMRLLHWLDDPKHMPNDDQERMRLISVVHGAGSPMMQAYVTAPWSKEEREKRIRALMMELAFAPWLERDGQRALDMLSRQTRGKTR